MVSLNILWITHQISLIVFLALLLLIALSNLWALRRLGTYPLPVHFPSVSVLVPARNEEANIGPCVRLLLAQEYPDFEVLVLDDESDDKTAEILHALAKDNDRLRVFVGQSLPAGWMGKHWACHRLAQMAVGDLLLFTDADTCHHPHTLRDGVAALLAEEADLLTAIPHQETVTWSERLVVPAFPWSIFVFLPLAIAHRVRAPSLSASVGQFMLFRRRAYAQIGGHAAVRQDAVDDIALGRQIKVQGLRWRVVDGGERISCRMYGGFREVCDGFTKNLLAGFGYNVPLFILVWVCLGVLFWEPLTLLALRGVGVPISASSIFLAIGAVALSLLLWVIPYWRFGFPLWLACLYPVTVLLAAIIASRSMLLTLRGQATWKGRVLG